ncbi:MAG TPA: methyltransferase [Microbacteriaceae bacterium]|nr:methyltransferase [Microbacteriaceae bacterium]
MAEPDAADRLALDAAAEHAWQRLVVWGDDVRTLALAAHERWPDADIAMWNDWIGPEVPAVPALSPDSQADLVLMRLPKALDALLAWSGEVARRFPDATLIAAGRIKHMTPAQNDVLAESYENVRASLARQKSRLLVASGARAGAVSTAAETRLDNAAGAASGLSVVAVAGTFAGATLDIGTRALLDTLDVTLPDDGRGTVAFDLGCGSGLVAAWLARRGYRVRASDRSRAAVASTEATLHRNGYADRAEVVWEDALAGVEPGTAELIVLNPPFHEGTRVTVDPAHRLFAAAARSLAPGGELIVVWNSHLRYRDHLDRLVGPTRQLERTPKFTVTTSRTPAKPDPNRLSSAGSP